MKCLCYSKITFKRSKIIKGLLIVTNDQESRGTGCSLKGSFETLAAWRENVNVMKTVKYASIIYCPKSFTLTKFDAF